MSGDVITKLNYLTKTTDGCSPWLQTSTLPGGLKANFGQEPAPVIIHDLRGKEATVDFDTNALEVLKYEGSIQEEFKDGSEAQRIYFEEISDIIKKRLGASRVITYHYAFRNRGTPRSADQIDDNHRNPAFLVHSDIDEAGVHTKIRELLGEEEADKVMQKRYEALHIWRPLGHNAITDTPLAICDYHSINVEKDIHPLELRGYTTSATACTITPNAHRWYYLSEMRSNEMFMFKMFDSKTDAAQCAFHTAFINKNVPPSNMEQKSLEIRCLVFYD